MNKSLTKKPIIEEDIVDPQYIINPIDTSKTSNEKAQELREISLANSIQVTSFTNKDCFLEKFLRSETSTKSIKSIKSKQKRNQRRPERNWYNIEHIRDALRFRMHISRLSDLTFISEATFSAIQSQDTFSSLVKIDLNKFATPTTYGWRFIGFDLRLADGQLVEFYMTFPEMIAACAQEAHEHYETIRDVPHEMIINDESLLRFVQDKMEKSLNIYDNAWSQALSTRGINTENISAEVAKIEQLRKSYFQRNN